MRTIKKVHQAENASTTDLITYRALPSRSIAAIDPFIFLNHHGHQVFPKNNDGLPFGPHPHRGFETVTFILEGDLVHKDSSGAKSIIEAGGVQWMTAGRGLIHSENPSDNFLTNGGNMEILQLWVNLPAKYKMVDPAYMGLQKKDIPTVEVDNGKVTINAVSGTWEGTKGAFAPLVDIQLASIYLKTGGVYNTSLSAERNIFFYVVKGKVKVNGQDARIHELVEFNNNDDQLEIKTQEDSILLLGHAIPFKEPIVAQGPFVMNTQEEINQAFEDYRRGLFGTWVSN